MPRRVVYLVSSSVAVVAVVLAACATTVLVTDYPANPNSLTTLERGAQSATCNTKWSDENNLKTLIVTCPDGVIGFWVTQDVGVVSGTGKDVVKVECGKTPRPTCENIMRDVVKRAGPPK